MNFILGTKKNMIQIFEDGGNVVPCTVIDVADNVFLGAKSKETDGYESTVIGKDLKKNSNKPEKNQFGIGKSYKYIKEFGTIVEGLNIGDDYASELVEGDIVDVTGTSKGKGFQGVVRAYHFKGGPKTHGQSTKHRSIGSIAQGQTFGHVHKGRRMPKKFGNHQVTVKNLQIVKYDRENKIILVKGAVPGMKGSYIFLKKARKQ